MTFRQIPLEKWPIGLASVAALTSLTPDDFSKRVGANFQLRKDDLDFVNVALFCADSEGLIFALGRHLGLQSGETEVVINEKSRTPKRDFDMITNLLGITPQELTWIRPDLI